MSRQTLAYTVFLLSVIFALAPFLATDFAGYNAEDFPVPQNNPVIQPAGWAFSIWGVIYLWLVAGSGYGAFRAAANTDWQAMRYPLAVSLGIGVFWLTVAAMSPLAATIMIVLMAAGAILALIRSGTESPLMQREPTALYAGWLTAATGVSIGICLPGYGMLDAVPAGVISLAGVLIVALWVQSIKPHAWAYAVGICWALLGILVKSVSAVEPQWLIAGIAAAGFLIIGGRAVYFSAGK